MSTEPSCFSYLKLSAHHSVDSSLFFGEVQEWLNWQHWKCCERETVPWVRIPPSPPSDFRFPTLSCHWYLIDGGRPRRLSGAASRIAPRKDKPNVISLKRTAVHSNPAVVLLLTV